MSFSGPIRAHYGQPERPPNLGTGLPPTSTAGDTPYGMAALAGECDALAAMPADSGRNSALNTAALKLAQLVASGHLTEMTMRINLEGAGRAAGLAQPEIDLILRDNANGAIAVGRATPRHVEPLADTQEIAPWNPPQANAPSTGTSGPVGSATAASPNPQPANTAAASEEGPAGDASAPSAPEHTSWWFRALDGVIDGTQTEPGPVHLTRNDGQALFYAGKVNGLIGESESGKTWVALLAVQQALHVGENVLYLDFEDSASGIIGRLRALGTTPPELARFAYVDPDETLHLAAKMDLSTVLDTHQPSLIVLDGFNAAMTLLGLDLQSNKDATTFAQALLKPLSRTTATVIYIDHLPKNRDAQGKGGIGAQAKRAMTTGCALRVDVAVEFGRGMTGRLKLTVDKDRAGHVRAASAGAKVAGQAVLISSTDGTSVDLYIEAPDLRPADERGPWRPTHLMESVSRFLETGPGPWSTKAIEDAVKGKAEHLRAAINGLVEDGYAARQNGARGALLHSSIGPYRETETTPTPPRPTSSPPRPGTRSNQDIRPRPSSPTLGGDEDEVEDDSPRTTPPRPKDEDEVNEPWWQK